MSELRKNHLSIDGGQIKEDDNVASYKLIPESDAEIRKKPTLSKSKEHVSDEAEVKLLDKEEEAKIVTRVDMADAKYVVGDHRNGDAKIELDANKRQFSGLTKEELLKYADDPFWVRLRWFMFVLFWALWLCMLAGAIAIIVRAPKCYPPPPKTWYEKGPLVDASSFATYEQIEDELPAFQSNGVQGIFTEVTPTYEVLDNPDLLTKFKEFVTKAKEYGVKVVVDLTPNFVSSSHNWFELSVNRTAPYDAYFTWVKGREYGDNGTLLPPNNWVSTMNTSAWTWHEARREFYLHQYGTDQPDLNFHNPKVVDEFDKVIRMWMKAGAEGIRLHKVRQIVVNSSYPDEKPAMGRGSALGADHHSYQYYRHTHTSDQPALDALLSRWSSLVADHGAGETVFTIAEEGNRPELFLLQHNTSSLRPPSSAPLVLRASVSAFVDEIQARLGDWPALELVLESATPEEGSEFSEFALLLPAAPVLRPENLVLDTNGTSASESFSHLVSLREDASVAHGQYQLKAVPAVGDSHSLLACARWKTGHTGYVAVFNPGAGEARANLTLRSVPPALTVHHVSRATRLYTNYTSNSAVTSDNVLVPPRSTVVLSYVPITTVEQ